MASPILWKGATNLNGLKQECDFSWATKKLIGVLIHGGTMAFPNATLDALDAVLDAWYPGLGGGEAVAATLFGDQSPAGRSSQTWYSSNADLPDQSRGYMVSLRRHFAVSASTSLQDSSHRTLRHVAYPRDSTQMHKRAIHTASRIVTTRVRLSGGRSDTVFRAYTVQTSCVSRG